MIDEIKSHGESTQKFLLYMPMVNVHLCLGYTSLWLIDTYFFRHIDLWWTCIYHDNLHLLFCYMGEWFGGKSWIYISFTTLHAPSDLAQIYIYFAILTFLVTFLTTSCYTWLWFQLWSLPSQLEKSYSYLSYVLNIVKKKILNLSISSFPLTFQVLIQKSHTYKSSTDPQLWDETNCIGWRSTDELLRKYFRPLQ